MSTTDLETCAKSTGRPRVLTDEQEALIACQCPELKSRRARQDWFYTLQGLRAVFETPGLEWLADRKGIEAGDDRAWKQRLLSELGRIDDPDHRIAVARQLCETKPTTADGVAMIRAARTGKRPEHDPDKLSETISKAIDSYRAKHAGCPLDDVRNAIGDLLLVVERMIDEHMEDDDHAIE